MIGRALALLTALVVAKTAQRENVDSQIARIRSTQTETGLRLQNNQDFHDYLMVTSQQRMPNRLERFWSNLNRNNMQRRLYQMYKWNVGKRDATRDEFGVWLTTLADWFEEYAEEEMAD